MNVGGISANYSAAYDAEKAQKVGSTGDFAEKIAGSGTGERNRSNRSRARF